MDDWTLVTHKRGRSAIRQAHQISHKSAAAAASRSSTPEDPRTQLGSISEEERLLVKVERAIANVEQSVFFARFMRQLHELEVVGALIRSGRAASVASENKASEQEKVNDVGENRSSEVCGDRTFCADGIEESRDATVELVVYGVGSIANSEISRCQLSLALLMKQRLSTTISNIVVYDPIMSASECRVMLTLGCTPLEANDEGRRPLNGPTLFYMPHCDVELYESVLQSNLKVDAISQLVILGNSFQTYKDRWSVSPLPHGERPSCLLKVQKFVGEIPVADDFSPAAFNDTSWHFFSKVDVSKVR